MPILSWSRDPLAKTEARRLGSNKKTAKRNSVQVLENKRSREISTFHVPTIPKTCERRSETFSEAERWNPQEDRFLSLETKSPVSRSETRALLYRQRALAFAVHRPKPLAIMLRMTAHT